MPAALEPRRAWVTMRTPGHDFELAAGWLVHEGLADADSLAQVAYCTDTDLAPEQEFNVVTVTLTDDTELPHRHVAASAGSSACGVCGKDSVAEALQTRTAAPWTGARPDADVVRRLPDALRERQTLFDRTGGVHAAGLADADGTLLVVREDVGRHNAVDKVVGARVLAGEPPPPRAWCSADGSASSWCRRPPPAGSARSSPSARRRASPARLAARGGHRPLGLHLPRPHRPLLLSACERLRAAWWPAAVGAAFYGRPVRILHTSDWHLGRSFHREDLLGHQAAFVDHLLEVVEAEKVDVVVVSGDVYDRALPHVDAVALADETFARLAASARRSSSAAATTTAPSASASARG